MGYIFVYTNSDHKGLTGIGYAEDWEKELKKLNKDPNNLGIISCDSVYEVNDKTDYERFVEIVLGLIPDSRFKKQTGKKTAYFDIPVKNVRNALDSFARQRGSGSVTYKPVAEKTSTRKKVEEREFTSRPAVVPSYEGRLNKEETINYLISKGIYIEKRHCTFASKNKKDDMYWANPAFIRLNSDWTFILDDTLLRKYYVLQIKGGSIRREELVGRRDMPNKIQITIKYGDPSFTDTTSGYSFARYKIAEINYPS